MVQSIIDTNRIIADHAVDPIFFTDAQGCVIYANPAAEKAFGYAAAEFAAKNLHDLIHHHRPDGTSCSATECPFHRSYTSGEVIEDWTDTFIRKDGTGLIMSGSSAPVEIDGNRVGQVVLMRDISRRVAAENALAESERRFRLITDSMPQLVWALAPDGSIGYANARFRQYFGTDLHSTSESLLLVHPDDVARTRGALEEALRTGIEYRVEQRLKAPDGGYRWFLSHGIPLKDGDGKMLAMYGSSTDIDDMRRASDALRRSQETLRLAAQATHLGLWEYTESGDLIWDETNRRIYGLPPDIPMTYEMFAERIHPEDRARIDGRARRIALNGAAEHFNVEFRIIRCGDGAERWISVNGQSLVDPDGHFRFVGTTLDVTDSKLTEQHIREASQRDALTGLPNRALLFEYCEHLLAIAQRTHSSGALLFIDLDHFKPINDTQGHDIGDQVLKQVAKRLLDCTRQEDIVGRLGGDEFVIALPHPDDAHGPTTVAQNIVERISAPYYIGSLQLHVSPSIGISMYPRHGDNLDALIKCADIAMYEAKKAGRKCYRFYTPLLEHASDRHLAIEMRLRHALEHGELLLYYQPVMELESGSAIGVEALLRLPMPGSEPLGPPQFLPVAEAAGLINQIGDWVAHEACRQHRQWREAGLPNISIAINVARQEFRQRSFVSNLASCVAQSGMDPGSLQIELKESTVHEDLHETIAALQELRSLGIRIALDDFGVGYSSVGLLTSLPLDKLKIDQSFINRIGRDAKSRAITDTVLALGRSLKLEVVGEGIESEDEVDYLRGHGCDQAQGFYFSKPLTAMEFEHWFRHAFSARCTVH
ncbi:EAL domain-containing protein [Noviherbaspirillum sp.]|uniref:sensor domain-containing protein n=1 Tax=Noviherbaspirillum sp. TaxID=1926288 RepID=UPI0025FC86A4|nr:EAL domain-containing protein [Noviherbaspirillum sp.]